MTQLRIALIFIAALMVVFWSFRPSWLSDQNKFLNDFMNHNFLAVIGILLAINLGSLSQLHLSFNEIERNSGNGVMRAARDEIKSSAWWITACFLISLLLMVIKPIVAINESIEAFLNGLAIYILIFYIFIMADITLTVFEIPANLKDDDEGDETKDS